MVDVTGPKKPTQPRKWDLWHTSVTPFHNADKPNTGSANTLEDWERCAEDIAIDGESVKNIRKRELRGKNRDRLFADEAELKAFFKAHLLQNIAPKNQEDACKYLMTALHQGGLLNPVTSAASTTMYSTIEDYYRTVNPTQELYRLATGELQAERASHTDEKIIPSARRTGFITTRRGFIVQEKSTHRALAYGSSAGPDHAETDFVGPDPGKDYVFSAQATIKVNFTDEPTPTLSVISATISYGNKEVKRRLDSRNTMRRLVDRPLRMLGATKVEDLTVAHVTPPEPVRFDEQFQLAVAIGKSINTLDKTIIAMQELQTQLKQFTEAARANLTLFKASGKPSDADDGPTHHLTP